MTRFISTTNCFVTRDNTVLMLRRSQDIYKFPGFWMGPGGRQEPSEDVLAACIREVQEETGLDIKNTKLRIVATHHYPHKDEVYLVFIFMADYAGGEPREEKVGKLAWLGKDEALNLEKLYPDLRIHLPLAFEESDELYFTHMEFDENSNIVRQMITPISSFEQD